MTLHKLLQQLDFERLAGTAGEERAQDVICGWLRQQGLKPSLEAFEFKGFEA